MTALPTRYQFTVEEYDRLFDAGVLTEDARVELIAGEIIEMSPMAMPHLMTISRLTHIVVPAVGPGLIAVSQAPILLGPRSKPEPDLFVFRDRDYGDQLPTAADVVLVIEVADSSRDYDRTVKLPLYATAEIPEAWIFDLVTKRAERHTGPNGGIYTQTMVAMGGQSIASLALPSLIVQIDAVFR